MNITKVAEGALISSYLQKAGGAVGFSAVSTMRRLRSKRMAAKPPVTFAYSDYGVNQVGYCIVTTKETVAKNPIW